MASQCYNLAVPLQSRVLIPNFDRIRNRQQCQNGSGGNILMTASRSSHSTNSSLRNSNLKSIPTFSRLPGVNAAILGEAIASEEEDLVFPSDEFSNQALVPSFQKVSSFFFFKLYYQFDVIFLIQVTISKPCLGLTVKLSVFSDVQKVY